MRLTHIIRGLLSSVFICIAVSVLPAAVMTEVSRDQLVSGGYSYYADPQMHTTGENFNNLQAPIDLNIDTPAHQFLIRTTPIFDLTPTGNGARVDFSLDTKASLSGTDAAFAYLSGSITQALSVDGQGLDTDVSSAFDWSIRGQIAPGDRISFYVGNGIVSAGGIPTTVTDTAGNYLSLFEQREIENLTDSVQSFSFDFHFESQPWSLYPYDGFGFTQNAHFYFDINRPTYGVEGESWIGFTDPGTSTRIVSATVPEPSTFAIVVGLFGLALSTRVLTARRFIRANGSFSATWKYAHGRSWTRSF